MRTREHGVHYHVIARCNNNERLLDHEQDCRRFLEYLKHYIDKHKCQVFNYVIMPSHVHLLLMTEGGSLIDKFMHDLCLAFSHYFNKRHERNGNLWRQKYRSKIIDDDYYALACLRYIDKNPVEAGLVKKPIEWPWNGYCFYAYGAPTEILTEHPSYQMLGVNRNDRKVSYRAMFEQMKSTDKDMSYLLESRASQESRRYGAAKRRSINAVSAFLKKVR